MQHVRKDRSEIVRDNNYFDSNFIYLETSKQT